MRSDVYPDNIFTTGPAVNTPRDGHAPDCEDRTVRLADVVRAAAHAAPELRPVFVDPDAVQRAVKAGEDVALYVATRDLLPPLIVERRSRVWRLDRVAYSGDDLPGSECNRSVGHWNPANQYEVFEVVSGRVLILSARSGDDLVTCNEAQRGSFVAIAPGSWHLTYAPYGPAIVDNAYSEPLHGRADAEKYFQRAPLPVTVRRQGKAIVGDARGRVTMHWTRCEARSLRLFELFRGRDSMSVDQLAALPP